ncbi:ER membrane protein complex subunit 7-like [Hydractinia symbiolongicarpus]|uniref:ER membrane protein complex subunit 7-like n=1 Tax=Hydractinia symbiolongicarpus TaxID=13093 RepID=UPI00254BCD43|nr:ER membrane protein complex subunit 7-like [Hydractinia symbiolongicarpus]
MACLLWYTSVNMLICSRLILPIFVFILLFCETTDAEEIPVQRFKIEGKVSVVGLKNYAAEWMNGLVILVNGGIYKGFLKVDGTFVVHSVPPGSYLVEVGSSNYDFPRYRIDITKGGKIRARHVNFLQPNAVQVVPYPLRFVASKQAAFFEIRESWKITDFLFNPMVLMMVLPILFVVVMPKLMSMADPEAQKEMQSQMSMFNNQKQMPDISEMITNYFGGVEKKKTVGAKTPSRGSAKKR